MIRARASRRSRIRRVLVAAVALPATLSAQSPPRSATLRYGTGYFDVPVAAVLPSLALRAGYAGFWTDVAADPVTDSDGNVVSSGSPRSAFHGDAAFGLGLLDRFELGLSVQSLGAEGEGGHLAGGFAKALLMSPARTGFGLAAGVRYVGAPDYGDGVARAPGRLGFPDRRARASFTDGRTLDTDLTLYGVATLTLPGPALEGFPPGELSLSAGYGTGMFREGGEFTWYSAGGSGGWFWGIGAGVELGSRTLLSVLVDHNGFDANAGVELTWRELRIRAFGLGLNHDGSSVYRSRKWGASFSLTACPLLNRACAPRVRRFEPPDTVRLPAPPPDTVVVARPLTPEGSVGRPLRLCLATGDDEWVVVTPVGDTLVGPSRLPTWSLPADRAFPGRYAGEDPSFDPGAPLRTVAGTYLPEGSPTRPACAMLVPWLELGGVPLFRPREVGDPPAVVYLPLTPGVWQRYRRTS